MFCATSNSFSHGDHNQLSGFKKDKPTSNHKRFGTKGEEWSSLKAVVIFTNLHAALSLQNDDEIISWFSSYVEQRVYRLLIMLQLNKDVLFQQLLQNISRDIFFLEWCHSCAKNHKKKTFILQLKKVYQTLPYLTSRLIVVAKNFRFQ